MASGVINIYGRLHAATAEGILTEAAEIKDENLNKTQAELNQEFLNGKIDKTVDDLVNYYLKTDTYTKQEVQDLVNAIPQFHYEVYPTIADIPSLKNNVLYLIGPIGQGSDKYEEYVYTNNVLTKIGDTTLDLSQYSTIDDLNNALVNYTTTEQLTTLLNNKQDAIDDLEEIRRGASVGAGINVAEDGALNKIILTVGNDRFALTGELIEKPAAPTLTAGGTFIRSKTVNITSSVSGATIRYTMSSNGVPPADPTIDTGTIGISINLPQDSSYQVKTYIIKAIAIKNGEVSNVATDTYNIKRQLENVVISLSGDIYSETRTVTITSSNSGIPIYYTTDGTDPTSNSLLYNANSKPIISSSCTIKARAITDDWELSTNITSVVCTVKNIQNVTISASDNEYARTRTLTMTCATSDVSIYYTLDGATPTSNSTLYNASSKPVISSTSTVKAIAIRSGWTNSAVASQSVIVAKANIRYGYTESTTIDLEGIYSLSGYEDKVSPIGEYTTSTVNAAYLWFCIPSNQTISMIKSSGYEVPMGSPVIVNTFKCYRSSSRHAAGTVITFNVE